MKKKIAFITEHVYPYFVGGQEKRVHEYAQFLKDAYSVKIISSRQWGDDKVITKDGVTYISICAYSNVYKKDGKRRILPSVRLGVATFFYVLRTDDDILDIDVFPYFPLICARLATIFRRKKILIVGYWAEHWGKEYWKQYYGILWWVGVFLEWVSLLSCNHVVANSQFTQKALIAAYSDKKCICVLPPIGVDLHKIASVPCAEKKYDMIYCGRLIFHKHVDHIIRVVLHAQRCGKKITALIVGNGPDEERIKSVIRDNGLDDYICHRNFVEKYDDLIAHITSARVMMQPSEREGFGITVLEAHACGLPVFVVNYPYNAMTELVTDTLDGFVCRDADDLIEKSVDFFIHADDTIWQTMTHNAQKSAQKYAKECIKERVLSYYNNLELDT